MSNRAAGLQRVLVVGLGLIGGSLACALRESGFAREVCGYDRDPACREQALESALVDVVADSLEEALPGAGLVVLAVPTLAVEAVLRTILTHAAQGAVITDAASVKGSVIAAAQRVFGAVPPRFVPGHPIAGSERSGTGAANAGLFRRHRVILTPTEATDPDALALVTAMWEATGAEVLRMDAAEHDRVLALTSHLPHMLAFSLVDALARQGASEEIFRFAAGGFRDFTRIASSDVVMWRDIALANRDAVVSAIDVFSESLTGLRDAVAAADTVHIETVFTRARAARERYLRWLEQGAAETTGRRGEA